MSDPRPVQVRFPNGMERVGIAITDDVVEVDAGIGLLMEPHDIITIDGQEREVRGIVMGYVSAERLDRPESEGPEATVRLRHCPL